MEEKLYCLRMHHYILIQLCGNILDSVLTTIVSAVQTNSDKCKKLTKAIGAFIANDLQPFSIVSDAGIHHLVKKLESH